MKYYRPGQKVPPSQIGGKATNLSWLYKKGYPVPLSVFLTNDLLDSYLRFNDLHETARGLTRRADKDLESSLTELRHKIRQGQWPEPLEKILKEISDLFSGNVAVRSSAVGEDSARHSFAGQYATRLNVPAQVPALKKALCDVWASAWDERVIQYRRKNNLPLNEGLGVVIQQMLQPQFAGVVFSLRPDDLEERYGVIEFVQGAGEQLVDGSQTPQGLVFERESKRWLKADEIPKGYEKSFERLMHLALQIEEQAGRPVDVEWAMESPGKLYLLQMRPITVQARGVLWTLENVGEVMPDVVTPFSWSILQPLVNQGYAYFLNGVGVKDYPPQGLFTLYRGRVYFNHSAFRELMNHFYVSRGTDGSKIRRYIAFTGKLLHSAWFFLCLPRRIRNYLKKYERMLSGFRFIQAEETDRLFKRMDGLIQMHQRTMALHISGTIAGELYYQLLDKLTRNWMGGAGGSADAALSGVAPVASTQSAKALAEMAERIGRQPSLKEQILRTEWPQAENMLRQSPQGKQVWRDLEDFLERYGHGALHEFELYYPRWREEPAYIWRNLQNYLKKENSPEKDIAGSERRFAPQFSGLGLIKKIVLNHVFRKAKFYNIYREELKQAFLKAHSELKKYLLAVGGKLVNSRMIDQPADALFFKRGELEDYTVKAIPLNLPRKRAAERKERRRQFEQMEHPYKLRQIGDEWLPLGAENEASGADLKGLPCSAGTVRGKVKIVLQAESFTSLNKNEILVARATNPGWAPLIMSAAAVVTEIGGALSHGAIIAREFGIPMVAAVPEATKRLHDGQFIEVNGSSGVIKILPAAG